MTKQLLNLHTITKITLILTTLLLLPNTMLAADQVFKDNLGGTWYDSDDKILLSGNITIPANGSFDIFSSPDGYLKSEGSSEYYAMKSIKMAIKGTYTSDPILIDLFQPEGQGGLGRLSQSGQTFYKSLSTEYYSAGVTLGVSQPLKLTITNSSSSALPLTISSIEISEEVIPSYGISIALTEVDYINANDILGDGTASFLPASGGTPATLTLNGFHLESQISSSIQNLTVHLIGENSINSGSDWAPFHYTGGGDTTPKLTFESTEEEAGELIMSGAFGTEGNGTNTTLSMNYGYETITNKFDNGVGSGFLGDWAIIQEEGEAYRIFRNAKYNLWVGEYQVSKANKTSIASGYPTYDDKTNTLKLSEGYNIAVKSGMNNLTLGIRGASCSLSQVKFEPVSGGPISGTLTIEKYNDETYPVNTLTINNENGAIVGFSNVMVNSPINLAIPNSTPSTWDENIKEVVFSDEDIYNLKVAGNYVTSSNANNVLGMVQADKPTASFDAEKNTLTLQMASIGSDMPYAGSAIESGLDNLTVKFIGPSNINSNKAAFKALNESAKITFALDEEPGECYLGNGGIEGFAQKTFKNGLCYTHDNADQPRYYIKYLSPPSISYSDSQVIIHKADSDYYSAASVYYSVAYHDGVDNVEGTIYTGPFSMDKPGTVTTWLSTGEGNGVTKSVKAKLFEFAGPLKTTYDGTERILEESDIPKILPEVEGIEYSFEEPETNSVIGTTDVSDINKLTVKGLGKATIRAYIMPKESYDFEILNKNGDGGIDLEADILPSAPTFSINEGTYDETQSLVLTAPYKKLSADDPTTINVKYYIDGDSSNPQEYSDQISINKSSSITAWVEAIVTPNTGGAPQTYESEKITKEYVIKEEPSLGFYKEVEENEFGEIGTDDVITSTYGNTTPKIKFSDTSDLQGTLVFTSSNENVVASSSISTKFYEELEVTLLNYTIKGAGETTITATYTPAQNEPFLPKTISFKLKINPRDITDASLALGETSFTYTGTPIVPATTVSFAATETASTVTLTKDTDYSVECTDNTNVGTATITVTGKGNYTGTLSTEFTITAGDMTVTAEGYSGTYDGKDHGISVTAPETAKVMYGTKKGTYDLEASPTYTDAGTYKVYYQVTQDNYNTIADSATVAISKANIEPAVTLEGWTYGETAKTPSVEGNTGNGEVTYTYQAAGAETFTTDVPAVVGTHTVKATIAETTNYNGAETTTEFTIAAASMTATAEGYSGTYDGKAYGITITAPDGAKVMYGTKKDTYDLEASPTYTDAGTYKVYYQVTQDNYNAITDSATVTISKADITPSVTLEGWTYGATANEPVITGNTGNGEVTYTYKAAGAEAFATEVPAVVGTHTVKATIAETTNYNGAEATTEFTIAAASMTVTAEGYSGTYDGKSHGITITAPEGAKVMYGTKKDTYDLEASPTYTDAGTYKVYYQVTQDNYNTIADSATVTISKADITPTVTLEGWTYGATANEPVLTGNTGNGEVTYTYKAAGAEAFATEVPAVVGTHTVKATIAETTNYNGAEATATFTISATSMTVTAEGYSGTYDGKDHGITVTAPDGAKVMYGTKKGTYDLEASPTYTDAGTYKVYYQVTQDNYNTIADSATVTIAKAAGGLTYSAATASAELNGNGWTAPELNNPNNQNVTYTSSNTAVATISEAGVVTLAGIGETTIKAASVGDANHEASEAQYVLTVSRGKAKGYGVWIGETEVDEDNKEDVLGDNGTGEGDEKRLAPSFVFNPDDNTLLIIKSEAGLTIESHLPELKIHITGNNKLKAITYNNQGNSENTGTLMFTCDSNKPGVLDIENDEGKNSITGFKSVTFDETSNLCIRNGATTASSITIGTPLNPLTDNGDGTLNPDDFTTTNPDGTTQTADLTNTNINDILYTLPETTEGQGYNPEDNSISIVTPMSDNEVEKIIAAAKEQTVTVGSSDYAAQYLGITFLISGGKGDIIIDQEAVEGYEFHLKIGDGKPVTLGEGTAGRLKVTIEYEVPDATYCWLYLVQKTAGARGWGNTRVGKRDHAHGHIHSVSIKAKSVSSSNSASKASGGTISVETNAAITGIEEVKTDTERAEQGTDKTDDRWYTMDGRQINKPTQKGLYIRNRKKVVIK